MSELNIPTTYGALLCGSLFAFALSGILTTQVAVYWKLYGEGKDNLVRRTLVFLVWALDLTHSGLLLAACWFYFVDHFTQKEQLDHLPLQVALSILTTALQTIIYHLHFAHKIHIASARNWKVTGPIIFFAFARLLAASVTTAEMIIGPRYSLLHRKFPGWVITLGLCLSVWVDVLVSGCMCFFLWKLKGKSKITRTIKLVDSLMLYTLENGALTCVFTIASVFCWLAMPNNLVFLGLYFVIEKLYANSLVASLNTRKVFQMRSGGAITFGDLSSSNPVSHSAPLAHSGFFSSIHGSQQPAAISTAAKVQKGHHDFSTVSANSIPMVVRKVEVNVQQVVERNSDDLDDASKRVLQP